MSLFSAISKLITGMVGDQRENRPEDVRKVKSALDRLGYFDFRKEPEPHGYVTREMDSGIKRYQKERGLRVDGWLRPGGETESALKRDLKRNVSDDIQKEELLPPKIPGTNIPDEGVPEDYVRPDWDKNNRVYETDKEIEKMPPLFDFGIFEQYDREAEDNIEDIIKGTRRR